MTLDIQQAANIDDTPAQTPPELTDRELALVVGGTVAGESLEKKHPD
jgi:hypothetical protein